MTTGREEQLVDQWWERLRTSELNSGPPLPSDDTVLTVTRDQLCEVMTDAMLLAIDQFEDKDAGGVGRPVAALAQSLKCMSEARAEEGAQGHAVIATRARTFAVTIANHVTRFLEYPSLLVRHATMDVDLTVSRADVGEDGRVLCTCHPMPFPEEQYVFPLGELTPAGPVDDAVRIIAAHMTSAVVQDMVAQLVEKDALKNLPEVTTDWRCVGCKVVATVLADVDTGPPDRCLECRCTTFALVTASVGGHDVDHCNGCDIPEAERVNLPEGWRPGDIVQSGLTVHWTLRDLRRFVFVGDPARNNRHYFTGSYPQQATVHHLGAHAEYVMEPGSTHAEPSAEGG